MKQFIVAGDWVTVFFIIFGLMLLMEAMAKLLSKNFYTLHVFVRKFSILDLEFPDTSLELFTYLRGIFLLPPELSQKSLRSLKRFLYLDFIFIIFLYGSLFVLCTLISGKFTYWGYYFFMTLAWLQIASLICDAIKNAYLLLRIKKIGQVYATQKFPESSESKTRWYHFFQVVERMKWLIALLTAVCCISMLFYFWLIGKYSITSTRFAVVLFIEIVAFIFLRILFSKGSRIDLDKYQNIGN